MSKSIVLGGGCFWCTEAVFQNVRGVSKVTSGYAGGSSADPTYRNHADHAEVVKVNYEEGTVSLKEILDIIFATHDPTTLNRQGYDQGTEYRSIILCGEDEIVYINDYIKEKQKDFKSKIVTEVKVLIEFYEAEDYHQDFYNNNRNNGYCMAIIDPKLDKFYKNFSKNAK